jgi:excisionase family DNA binding protein
MDTSSKLLTPHEAAALLKCSVDSVRRLCGNGSLKAIDIGTKRRHIWRVYEDAIHEMQNPVVDRKASGFGSLTLFNKYSR